jgi:hypothetical protein
MKCIDCKYGRFTYKQDHVERGNEYVNGFCNVDNRFSETRVDSSCERFYPRPDPAQLPLGEILREPTSLELFNLARRNNATVGDSWANRG